MFGLHHPDTNWLLANCNVKRFMVVKLNLVADAAVPSDRLLEALSVTLMGPTACDFSNLHHILHLASIIVRDPHG